MNKIKASWGLRKRPPDMVIFRGPNEHYIERWFILPRNRWFNVYLHKILLDDYLTPHDHPWWNVSVPFSPYWEFQHKVVEVIKTNSVHYKYSSKCYLRMPYRPVFRKATSIHRIAVQNTVRGYAWSLFITGPQRRIWGFWTRHGFVSHEDALEIDRIKGTSKLLRPLE